MRKAIIFDLDGTLTYTLQDLADSANYALRRMRWPERSLDEIRQFVGNGVHKLIERAAPSAFEGRPVEASQVEACFAHFRRHYLVHCQDHTTLYPGISDLLTALKERGLMTAIVSNKLQAGVDELYDIFFRGLVDVAIGQREGMAMKPAPDMVNLALRQLGVSRDEALYVGDSEVDVATARNASLPFVAVLWGFRDRDHLVQAGASAFVDSPLKLLALL